MNKVGLLCLLMAVILVTPVLADVQVNSPANGATVGSPVTFVASATTGCAKGVASMGIYVDNQLVHVVNGHSLNASLSLSPGWRKTVVQEWDYCGGSTYTPIAIQVTDTTGVWVTSPANNATVGIPVRYVATATTATCALGVASMGIYVNNQLNYVVSGAKLDTSLALYPGAYDTVVEEWDRCGGASFTHVKVNVPGSTFTNLQATKGWVGYGEYPPRYDICTNCGAGVTWKMTQGIKSPSLSGNATEFEIGGTTPYSDVLWTNALVGDMSTQGMPDVSHKIIPNLRNFTYDVYFYGSNLGLSQVMEFDINQYFNTMGFTWGHQCRIAGGHEFDIWDNVGWKWVQTGVPCNPVNNAWNHLTLQVQRTSDNKLLYHSITLNGVTTVIDRYFPPFNVGSWYGVTANFQLDGNYIQAPYSVIVDKFSLTYW